MSAARAIDRMDKRRRMLITPEGIAVPVTIASRGSRLGALVLENRRSTGRFNEDRLSVLGFVATAVLALAGSGLVAMVTTRRMAPFSLAQLTSHGVDAEDFDLIVAKGVIAPMAAYAPVAKGGFLHVDTPGVTRADMTKLDYRSRRRPMFPFERD